MKYVYVFPSAPNMLSWNFLCPYCECIDNHMCMGPKYLTGAAAVCYCNSCYKTLIIKSKELEEIASLINLKDRYKFHKISKLLGPVTLDELIKIYDPALEGTMTIQTSALYVLRYKSYNLYNIVSPKCITADRLFSHCAEVNCMQTIWKLLGLDSVIPDKSSTIENIISSATITFPIPVPGKGYEISSKGDIIRILSSYGFQLDIYHSYPENSIEAWNVSFPVHSYNISAIRDKLYYKDWVCTPVNDNDDCQLLVNSDNGEQSVVHMYRDFLSGFYY